MVDLPPAHFKVCGRFAPYTLQRVWSICPLHISRCMVDLALAHVKVCDCFAATYTHLPPIHMLRCVVDLPPIHKLYGALRKPHICVYIVFYEIKHCLEDPKILLTHQ